MRTDLDRDLSAFADNYIVFLFLIYLAAFCKFKLKQDRLFF